LPHAGSWITSVGVIKNHYPNYHSAQVKTLSQPATRFGGMRHHRAAPDGHL